MTIVSNTCTINIINDASMSVNDESNMIIDDSRVMLQIVASLINVVTGDKLECLRQGQILPYPTLPYPTPILLSYPTLSPYS